MFFKIQSREVQVVKWRISKEIILILFIRRRQTNKDTNKRFNSQTDLNTAQRPAAEPKPAEAPSCCCKDPRTENKQMLSLNHFRFTSNLCVSTDPPSDPVFALYVCLSEAGGGKQLVAVQFTLQAFNRVLAKITVDLCVVSGLDVLHRCSIEAGAQCGYNDVRISHKVHQTPNSYSASDKLTCANIPPPSAVDCWTGLSVDPSLC